MIIDMLCLNRFETDMQTLRLPRGRSENLGMMYRRHRVPGTWFAHLRSTIHGWHGQGLFL